MDNHQFPVVGHTKFSQIGVLDHSSTYKEALTYLKDISETVERSANVAVKD